MRVADQPQSSTVLRDARLPDRPDRWDLHLEQGRIARIVAHDAQAPSADVAVRDLCGQMVLPSFVDAHVHLDKAFQADLRIDGPASLKDAIAAGARMKGDLTSREVMNRVLAGARQAIVHGTTRLRTHVDVDTTIGLAGVIGALAARDQLTGLVDVQVVAFPQEGLDREVASLLAESLALGCDALGGIPARQDDPEEHIRRLLDLADHHDALVDMHIDESVDPADRTLELLADAVLKRGLNGRVTAGHCSSLGVQPSAVRAEVIAKLHAAAIHVVVLPSTNLHLLGRDQPIPPRGVAPVRALLDGGVNVAFGSDNVRDAFNPFGNLSMIESGLLLAHVAQLSTGRELLEVVRMATCRASAVLDHRALDRVAPLVEVGQRADLLAFDVDNVPEIIVGQVRPHLVLVAGQTVVERHEAVSLTDRLPPADEAGSSSHRPRPPLEERIHVTRT